MPYQEGDTSPPHINVHNEVVPQVQALANEMGVDVDLPPVRGLGDSGHVDDHNLIHTALDKIAAEGSAGASWAQVINAPDAVTSSYYDDKGGQWQYYEWNAAGTFDVEVSGGLLWVLCVGGGDSGQSDASPQSTQGQPGLVNEGLWEFGPGTHTVTVGHKGANNANATPEQMGAPSSIGDYGTQGYSNWGQENTGRGGQFHSDPTGYVSSITGDPLEYATGQAGTDRPGRSSGSANTQRDGCVIIATRIDVPTLPPAPPRLDVAPVVAAPVSISGPAVQEWLVRDKQGNRKVVYFLPGNTGAARSLGLTEEGAAALEARRDLLDAIATTEVPEDYEGDPVNLLPKKLRAELRGFVTVRTTALPEAAFSVTLGAGVLPGVMVGSGGPGGYDSTNNADICAGGGGAGGVIGQGAHVPIILPVQGTATYTVKVGGTSSKGANENNKLLYGQCTTLAVQGQQPFIAAIGGGGGGGYRGNYVQGSHGASGGGGVDNPTGTWQGHMTAGAGIPGQGNNGGNGTWAFYGSGGGYSEPGNGGSAYQVGFPGGKGFDLATALNLDPNDGLTGSFLDQVSVDGWIAGGGSTTTGSGIDGGGARNGDAKDYTGGGGGGGHNGNRGGAGGAGAVYIITDPT